MLRERVFVSSCSADTQHIRNTQVKTYATPHGAILLRRCCSASFVEGLRVEDGLRAFARNPEREYQLLLNIARNPDNMLTLAYTFAGEIIGQATLAPLDAWWSGIDHAYEVAVEVSSSWRQYGVANRLLSLALEFEALEEYLILGLGFSWHWDMEGLGLTRFRYRELIAKLFAAHGFAEYLTSEPNIRMDPANILVARLGSRLNKENMDQFFQRLFKSEMLPGL